MAVADVGSSSVFQTPGAAKPPQANPPPPAPPANDDEDAPKAQQAQAPNTNPSEDERKQAEDAGRTRGSFVNVQA